MGTVAKNDEITAAYLVREFKAYCQEVQDNPLKVPKGKGFEVRMRPLLLGELLIQLHISKRTWSEWRLRADLQDAAARIEEAIETHKLRGAYTGTFVPTVSAQDLGLSQKKEKATTAIAAPPAVQHEHVANRHHPDMTDEQLDALEDAGLEPPLYSDAQIAQGLPFTMPKIDA